MGGSTANTNWRDMWCTCTPDGGTIYDCWKAAGSRLIATVGLFSEGDSAFLVPFTRVICKVQQAYSLRARTASLLADRPFSLLVNHHHLAQTPHLFCAVRCWRERIANFINSCSNDVAVQCTNNVRSTASGSTLPYAATDPFNHAHIVTIAIYLSPIQSELPALECGRHVQDARAR